MRKKCMKDKIYKIYNEYTLCSLDCFKHLIKK